MEPVTITSATAVPKDAVSDQRWLEAGFPELEHQILNDALENGPNHKIYATMLLRRWGFLVLPVDPLALMQAAYIAADGKKSLVACELGAAFGATAARMVEFFALLGIANTTYFCVDNLCHGMAPTSENLHSLKFVQGDRSVLIDFPALDFAFIDACHCAECVHKDSIAMSHKVAVGGVMAFHDTSKFGQYPLGNMNTNTWQRTDSHAPRPVAVVEGISSSRPLWRGEWDLVIQSGDWLSWGGVRAYRRVK